MNIRRHLKSNLGFTIAEMVTTVAIVGIVTSIGIPSYLQARRTTNMEIVRQHMKQIGEKLIEILGKKGKFSCAANSTDPACETKWPLIGSFDPDEQAITASLSAIDNLCYTTDGYSTNTARTSYRFCSSPKLDSCGNNAGNKRFCVHYDSQMSALFAPSMVGEVEMWDGLGGDSSWYIDPISLDRQRYTYDVSEMIDTRWGGFDAVMEQLRLAAAELEFEAILRLYAGGLGAYLAPGKSQFSTFMYFNDSADISKMNDYFRDAGIQIQMTERTSAYILQKAAGTTYGTSALEPYDEDTGGLGMGTLPGAGDKAYEVSFQFQRPANLTTTQARQDYFSQNEVLREYIELTGKNMSW
ncbi:MAG: hypothetical protein A3G33_02220 [Omnitrophica bacterium RIFCSPLOWO2_12_FULL_44_17]|uniref:Prepilin-type N-terminal cleavage/methylation domain-containing protein n=1 Tax=Candidatus Danuiimicrobium aquiferis TaxID=1801832 RepID=A0A1G1L261_9BACT|nr:MAG: hypothetical protein A3B72_08740 [Omnitrophica bacterium RIFCSPHIGHO2_02_FULL_45_28]OGW90826.1 MAG: hypothetical protein A3E74_05650 [Omnitrophica bacterium RIFCSPHIGHO2_12_FULL_44_12]OGW99231.1 MAG: hypothetical protein A3G33_02220 [Omnitrophica bacterium RIFCSPLOWO2_12_FULL_44_17]OGX04701.1 MAG: hypothetical protein A3J12_00060 [Omnitrophica bacterium RIFCSPLOWO2_02_FULL_44_11]